MPAFEDSARALRGQWCGDAPWGELVKTATKLVPEPGDDLPHGGW